MKTCHNYGTHMNLKLAVGQSIVLFNLINVLHRSRKYVGLYLASPPAYVCSISACSYAIFLLILNARHKNSLAIMMTLSFCNADVLKLIPVKRVVFSYEWLSAYKLSTNVHLS